MHYVPSFPRIEPRLAAGFELLEGDHGALHTALGGMVELANRVLAHDGAVPAQFRAELARFHDAGAEERLLVSCSRVA